MLDDQMTLQPLLPILRYLSGYNPGITRALSSPSIHNELPQTEPNNFQILQENGMMLYNNGRNENQLECACFTFPVSLQPPLA